MYPKEVLFLCFLPFSPVLLFKFIVFALNSCNAQHSSFFSCSVLNDSNSKISFLRDGILALIFGITTHFFLFKAWKCHIAVQWKQRNVCMLKCELNNPLICLIIKQHFAFEGSEFRALLVLSFEYKVSNTSLLYFKLLKKIS